MFVESALSAGYADEMELLHELLRWPLQWSAVSGVMELKTPLMRIVTATDYASQRRVVRLKGDRYPELGGAGLGFPYDNSQLPKTAVPKVLGIRARGNTNHLFNGFSTAEAMDRAHSSIVEGIKDALDGDVSSVIDLGCGNGALLAHLQRDVKSVRAFGVDVSAEAVRAAQRVHASGWHRFRRGNLFDVCDLFTERFDCAILMPGRVLEANEHQRGKLVSFLHGRCRNVVFYCYSDLVGHEFSALVRSLGFEPTSVKRAGFTQVCVARNRGLTSVALPLQSSSTPPSIAASRRTVS